MPKATYLRVGARNRWKASDERVFRLFAFGGGAGEGIREQVKVGQP